MFPVIAVGLVAGILGLLAASVPFLLLFASDAANQRADKRAKGVALLFMGEALLCIVKLLPMLVGIFDIISQVCPSITLLAALMVLAVAFAVAFLLCWDIGKKWFFSPSGISTSR